MLDPRSCLSVTTRLHVTSPVGEQLTLPVVSGRVSYKAMESGMGDYALDVTVPRIYCGEDLQPHRPEDALSCCGSTAVIEWEIEDGTSRETYLTPVFWLETIETGPDTIQLSGHGRLSLLDKAHRARPKEMGGRTYGEVFHEIFTDPFLPDITIFDAAIKGNTPKDYKLGTGVRAAVEEILQAFTAVLREYPGGLIQARPTPSLDRPPVGRLVDGEDGTVVSAPSKFDRAWRVNRVIVRGNSDAHGEFAQEATERFGPFRPEVYGLVCEEVSNPAIDSPAQAATVALNTLRERGKYARTLQVRALTQWHISLDDIVDFGESRGLVVGVEWPLDGSPVMDFEITTI